MKHIRTLMLLALLQMAVAACSAAPADEGTRPTAGKALYAVTFNVQLGSPVPAGEAVICKARVTPGEGDLASQDRWASATGTVTAFAAIAGNTANCSLVIPFSWSEIDPRRGAALRYEIEVVRGVGPVRVQTRAYPEMDVALPPADGTASVRLNVQF